MGLHPALCQTRITVMWLTEAKAKDILGLYLDPPKSTAVFCIDEEPPFRHWIAVSRPCLWGPEQT